MKTESSKIDNSTPRMPSLKNEGVNSPWYLKREISDEKREFFRQISLESRQHKAKAVAGDGPEPNHPINKPNLLPEDLMPKRPDFGLRSLSLFSGGGGLDVGFERAGYEHVASYEILQDAGLTLKQNRPEWSVYCGDKGDVRMVDWGRYRGKVDLIHAGPPCQPFSIAGRQKGKDDVRNMFQEFIRTVKEIMPVAFVAENVPALGQSKFSDYVNDHIMIPLKNLEYNITRFELCADKFGVPQVRKRIFFVGFKNVMDKDKFIVPVSTHSSSHLKPCHDSKLISLFETAPYSLKKCMGVREALGLEDIGFDALAPTIRSGLTGPRHTTSILNSTAAAKIWDKLQVWPNGVAASREAAHKFVAQNGHFRLSVQDCAILQGFPTDWTFNGAVYMCTGQIGNSVAPPVAYRVACAIADALRC